MKQLKFRKLARMNLQKGFTLFELLFVVWVFVCIAAAGMIYVICHFLAKFW